LKKIGKNILTQKKIRKDIWEERPSRQQSRIPVDTAFWNAYRALMLIGHPTYTQGTDIPHKASRRGLADFLTYNIDEDKFPELMLLSYGEGFDSIIRNRDYDERTKKAAKLLMIWELYPSISDEKALKILESGLI